MKVAGLLLLFAGWLLVIAALMLLPPNGARTAFIAAGVCVEILGFVLTVRAHLTLSSDARKAA